ncbi:acetyl-CoA hydrolase/transferase family protein [Sphingomonas solaris]|uniref:Acetyl-CoA hydrolase/transferase family protein n=1 Tax=Alterirhizorhabdus solaris TaxID=2529389 RepID=A0A558RB14_9SPHN|nr:acetyl-CoA hydrolase/transferase C-terminal domain-containing protein [Sphingomonas solaris]TVV76566.1 acetyl-CoA hydrolase/transferase family protein [Sphingomonas solaris]
MALGAGAPPAILAALAERVRAGGVRDLSLYYLLSMPSAGRSVLDFALREHVTPMSFFHGSVERALDAVRVAQRLPVTSVLPSNFSQVPRAMREHIGVDTLLATVSPMDADGNFSLGTSVDYSLAVSRKPGVRVILEVNPRMPHVRGDSMIHISQVAALVENEVPLFELATAQGSPADDAIGRIIAGLVADGACLQMGIGALPDAVCAALRYHRHLGIHTEMMTSGLVRLIRSGVVDNSRKQIHAGRSIFTFALGDAALYDFLNDNEAVEAHPVDHVNDPAVIARNANVVSVNATLEVDLQGACNSEYRNGRQYSATGGQLDFVRGAYASPGGKSIIACHSTAAGGTVSRIVARLSGPVTTPRTDTHIVVTEYGHAELKGKSTAERARALIAIAHPDFRDGLAESARAEGLFL